MSVILIQANAGRIGLKSGSIHCCVCSPPYWNLRDYGTAQWVGGDPKCDHLIRSLASPKSTLGYSKGQANHEAAMRYANGTGMPYRDTCGKCGAIRIDNQLGLEPTPDQYVANMVAVFREVWRVLRDDGTCWLNLGDSYAAGKQGRDDDDPKYRLAMYEKYGSGRVKAIAKGANGVARKAPPGLKPKDLVGIPWRVAFALQADGWYLRSDIIWSKPNPMPESVTDRPTKSHEYLFLLTKSERYFYDSEAIKEIGVGSHSHGDATAIPSLSDGGRTHNDTSRIWGNGIAGRNRRTVWQIATAPYSGAHFATYPPALVEPCVKAGTSEAGACSVCGKPWERVVENHGPDKVNPHDRHTPYIPGRKDNGRQQGLSQVKMGAHWHKETLGFRPACAHYPRALEWEEYINPKDPKNPTPAERAENERIGRLRRELMTLFADYSAVPCTVLDPFNGSGTTGLVAQQLGRNYVGLDLSAEYLQLARERIGLKALDEWTKGKKVEPVGDGMPLFEWLEAIKQTAEEMFDE